MKRVVITLVLIIITLFAVSALTRQYTKTATVISVNNNTVMVEDCNGYLWTYETKTPIEKKGDTVILTMSDKYTENNIFDDEVIGVKVIR